MPPPRGADRYLEHGGLKTAGRKQFLLDGDCNIWLLTEVGGDTVLAGYDRHLELDTMTARKRWAGVFSRR